MGSDDIFKKRKKNRVKRKHDFKTPHANSFLIVTEGTKTEPIYFNAIKNLIQQKIGGRIDIRPFIDIQGQGKGCSPKKLIDITDQVVKTSKVLYQNIWIVFDRDEFEDFDDAIKEGIKKEYHIAWSNQCFEYWLYLHLHYSNSALHRDKWYAKLDECFKKLNLNHNGYQKNDPLLYEHVSKNDGVKKAIRNAKQRMKNFNANKDNPSEYDPGTTVHLLVEELQKYLK